MNVAEFDQLTEELRPSFPAVLSSGAAAFADDSADNILLSIMLPSERTQKRLEMGTTDAMRAAAADRSGRRTRAKQKRK